MAGQHALDRSGDYDALYRNYVLLQKEIDHLSILREIALAINSSIELSEVLPVIAEVVQGALEVSRLTIYELDDRSTLAKPIVAKFGDDLIEHERLQEESMQLVGTPLGQAIRTRVPVLVNTEVQSAAFIPLLAKGMPIGVMRIEDRFDGTPFEEDFTSLFQSIGAMIALAISNAQLYALGVTDGLTGLYMRRYFDIRMRETFEQAKRYDRTFSLLLFDIDHFKNVNDTHGHQSGDQVLKQFAQILMESTRKCDIACRYGGEEMALILPETSLDSAAILADKLCTLIGLYAFSGLKGEELSITTSVGVAEFLPEYWDPEELIESADQALYRAKDLGRNRVELATS
ncbi:MAG: sensor domain-containing diguanylate cyclase [Candidatus Hydrogenedentes bacterium]|nr:sensor domain-containing diguanylate cyclase [Candidatus Hydrogenedentota bacterium]